MENGNVFCLCDFLFQSRFLLLLQNMHKKMTQPQFIENLTELCDGKDFPKDLLKVIVYHITRYTRILDNIIMLEKNATDIYRLNHNYHQMLLASGGASGIFFFLVHMLSVLMLSAVHVLSVLTLSKVDVVLLTCFSPLVLHILTIYQEVWFS